ncbi:hypothetical protein N7463_007898, partial [Penicillium fimorum]
MSKLNFKVVVVGGSISGLTLAHGLEKLGIDYVVLEKRDQIAPQEGTFIGLLPNGSRVLEQLGLFANNIEKQVQPLTVTHLAWGDGFCYTTDAPATISERFGFPIAFIERQKLLDCLRLHLSGAKIHLNKTFVGLEELNDGTFNVYTKDGDCYHADLVVGADGVHSKVRAEMWRLANDSQPSLVSQEEMDSMTIEYNCTWGISSAVPGLKVGEQTSAIGQGLCILVFTHEYGCVYWFFTEKLDRKYSYAEAPRYTREETWGDLWEKRLVFTKSSLEEVVMQRWHWHQIVFVGDSMHKMAPNSGQGANSAIEDIAGLLNALKDSFSNPSGPVDLEARLSQFNAMRLKRIKKVDRHARLLVRFHTQDSLLYKIIGRHIVPRCSRDLVVDFATTLMFDATKLLWAAEPARSGPVFTSATTKAKTRSLALQLM